MQLSRWKCLALVLVFTLGCGGETPFSTPPNPNGLYFLMTVGNQQPPVPIYEAPGDTTTVIFSVLTLTQPGTASVSDRIRFVHPGTAPEVINVNSNYTYRIIGDSIAFDYPTPCGPADLCIAPPGGHIVGERLLLTFGNPPYRPPFLYAHPGLD